MNKPTASAPTTEASAFSPRKLYGALALAEMVTWALLIFGMVLKYTDMTPAVVPVAGMLHGTVFVAYCVVTVFVWIDGRWSVGRGLLGLLSAIIPFTTYPFERSTLKAGLLGDTWRLREGGEEPRTLPERVQAWCLRHVALAIVIGVLLVAAIVTVLLILGPPVPKG